METESAFEPREGDHVVRGTAADGMIRGFAACTRATVQTARDCHQTSPVVTAALGRLLTAGAMMGAMLKDSRELITLSVRGDGPIASLTVTADAQGHVKGYAGNPEVWLPLNKAGKLDVGGAVGAGTLTVVQDQPWGEPYASQLALVSGEIGDDMAAYFATSEQVPTSVGLGVLVETDLSVRQAGGFIIQLMPGCSDEVVECLERNLSSIDSVTNLFEAGMSPTAILEHALEGLGFNALGASPVEFRCNCSRDRTARVLVAMGTQELQDLIDEGEAAELVCNFCNNVYTFTVEEMQELLEDSCA